MSPADVTSNAFVLRPTTQTASGDRVAPLELEGVGQAVVIGRTSGADWTVPEMTVSRRHARLELVDGAWLLEDLESRHGTWLNGQKLVDGERLPLRLGDEIRLGHWSCRCESGGLAATRLTTTPDERTAGQRVKSLSAELGGVAQQRLEALLDASKRLAGASDRVEVASVLVECAASGAGCDRVLLIRAVGESEFEVEASSAGESLTSVSQSLINAAAAGEVVQLDAASTAARPTDSIIDLKIRSAICAPLVASGVVDSFLYLDTRGAEATLPPDIGAYCAAIAQLGAMSIERCQAAEIAERRRQLDHDLETARRAQQLLLPSKAVRVPGVECVYESIPGRFVAGDLFDLFPLDDGRVAFFLGDVSGKGVGAGLLMAAAQSELRSLLSRSVDLLDALALLNEHIHERSETRTFLTLVAGVLDPASDGVTIADAGHGLVCLVEPGRPPHRLEVEGGLPIGVAPGSTYEARQMQLGTGARLVMFSDGVVEQTDDNDEQFGLGGALSMLEASDSPEADVEGLIGAVRDHGGHDLADDLTVVSIRLTGDQE